jgi:hypothetical protein
MIIVYALKCRTTGKAYIGSTKGKLAKRVREHRCLLNQGSHKTSDLLKDWQQFGEGDFSYIELEIFLYDFTLETRRAAELKWMEHFAKDGLLYNEHRISMRPTDEAIRKGVANAHLVPGNRWTVEANEARGNAQRGIPKGHGAKISATKKALRQKPSLEAARLGGLAATDKRWHNK